MSTKIGKFTFTMITSFFVMLLFAAGAKIINASASQIEFSDHRGRSTETALGFDDSQGGTVEFFGTIQAIEGSTWTISGLTVTIQPGTEIKGSLAVGDLVKVHAFRGTDGSLVVREIATSLGTFDDNSNANINGDDNGNDSDDGNANLNGNDDNGNDNNGNDDNGNEDNGNDHNGNDDNGNDDNDDNDDNGNDNGGKRG